VRRRIGGDAGNQQVPLNAGSDGRTCLPNASSGVALNLEGYRKRYWVSMDLLNPNFSPLRHSAAYQPQPNGQRRSRWRVGFAPGATPRDAGLPQQRGRPTPTLSGGYPGSASPWGRGLRAVGPARARDDGDDPLHGNRQWVPRQPPRVPSGCSPAARGGPGNSAEGVLPGPKIRRKSFRRTRFCRCVVQRPRSGAGIRESG
jgi:hypothetical protein